ALERQPFVGHDRRPMPDRRMAVLLQVLAGCGVAVACLAIVELGAALVLAVRSVPTTPTYEHNDAVSTRFRFIFLDTNAVPATMDLDLLWRNTPGASRTLPTNPRRLEHPETWSFAINSEGFRGAERVHDHASEVYRVLCIGDSSTFGI